MSALNSITVDVVSDVVCPWCYIGQKRLDIGAVSALQRLGSHQRVVILLVAIERLAVDDQSLGIGTADFVGAVDQAFDRVRHIVRLVDHVSRMEITHAAPNSLQGMLSQIAH